MCSRRSNPLFRCVHTRSQQDQTLPVFRVLCAELRDFSSRNRGRMSLPTQRLSITPTEYLPLKPGLDVLANGLANAKAGHFPHRDPWDRIDYVASDVYRD